MPPYRTIPSNEEPDYINFRALLGREGAWGIFYSVSSEEPGLSGHHYYRITTSLSIALTVFYTRTYLQF